MSHAENIGRLLARRLAEHQAIHDPVREPRNRLPWVSPLRRWQAQRLKRSFEALLDDPNTRPAAEFFLSDLYNDHDFSRRDAEVARVLPLMQRLLPDSVLVTLADAIELGALTHHLDLGVAEALQRLAPQGGRLDGDLYARAYRVAGTPALRTRQIDLIVQAGHGLVRAMRMPGLGMLLKVSDGPARRAGLEALQGFLVRGYAAFHRLREPEAFLQRIERSEREVSRRLFAAHPDPFGVA